MMTLSARNGVAGEQSSSGSPIGRRGGSTDASLTRIDVAVDNETAHGLSQGPCVQRHYVLHGAVLGGEVAVPCTRNPLQRGRIPARGFVSVEPAPSKWR